MPLLILIICLTRVCRYDGQAGAAAITLVDPSAEDSFISTLFDRLQARGLALYQMPRLIRFRAS